ncbi:MAG: hypothetical protein ACXAC7_16615, partial [Candidatus Hodarchaeales archaeon]
MNRFIYYLIVIFLLLNVLVYFSLSFMQLETTDDTDTIDSVWMFGLAFIGFIAFLLLARIYSWKSHEGRIWLAFAIGVFFWSIGEFLWFYYETILEEDPFPSAADVIWILAFLPLIY